MENPLSQHERRAASYIAGAMLSHPGLVRAQNEDAVLYCVPRPEDPSARLGVLALVADGMGGHAAGEVASAIAARTIRLLYYQQDGPVPSALARAFEVANQLIYEQSAKNPDYDGMGTTCTALVMRDEHVWLAHVGDSRAYIVRNGEIHQLSNDHSLVASLVRDGTMTLAEAASSPEKNVILRALGTKVSVEPQVWNEGLRFHAGDVIVLCSDGLTDLVDDATIAATVSRRAPFEACQALVDAALSAGGRDNISVGVFGITAAAPLPAKRERPTRTTNVRALLGEQP
ncbi:MAG: Stp1/IreP family PP2C-type Ser/Thr phosphatase [Alphaproteobacteria bacterium]|nr:Stp1/IreP family PP2C-type Ser/Thr phosphatase [Alphaproteobacteria bacterium]